MNRRIEIQVGLTVIAALVILIWGVIWLKDLTLHRHERLWNVHFEQTGGLARSDEVQVNGLRRGEVKSVDLADDGVIVHLALDSSIRLTHDSRIAIRPIGLMGERVIAVTLRPTGEPYTERDTIPGRFEMSLPEMAAGLGGTVGSIASLAEDLEDVARTLNKDGNLTETLRNFRVASDELRKAVQENRAGVRDAVSDFRSTVKTTREVTAGREEQLKRALDQFAATAERLDRFSSRLDSLRATLQSVSGKVDRGDGTLGQLVNDRRVYDETRVALAELRSLIADIRANPKKYLTVKIF